MQIQISPAPPQPGGSAFTLTATGLPAPCEIRWWGKFSSTDPNAADYYALEPDYRVVQGGTDVKQWTSPAQAAPNNGVGFWYRSIGATDLGTWFGYVACPLTTPVPPPSPPDQVLPIGEFAIFRASGENIPMAQQTGSGVRLNTLTAYGYGVFKWPYTVPSGHRLDIYSIAFAGKVFYDDVDYASWRARASICAFDNLWTVDSMTPEKVWTFKQPSIPAGQVFDGTIFNQGPELNNMIAEAVVKLVAV